MSIDPYGQLCRRAELLAEIHRRPLDLKGESRAEEAAKLAGFFRVTEPTSEIILALIKAVRSLMESRNWHREQLEIRREEAKIAMRIDRTVVGRMVSVFILGITVGAAISAILAQMMG